MANAAKKNADALNDDLHDQIAIMRDDIATLTSTLADYGRAQGAHLRAVANDKVNEAAAKGAQSAEELRDAAAKTYADTEEAVRANPAVAMGIAAGAGFLIGMLTARRK